ncbi:MAG: UpxY family transcription antiterminator [Thermodesulfobacteriota bacterium]|nr:UpxY family transcription antiterminator [Thermodesulfobacteriota bacterium]
MSNSQTFFRDEDISGQNPVCLGAVPVQSWPASSATWYAIYTKCHHEFTIWSQLQKKSIEMFFPCVTRWSRRKDRKLKIQVPLFPGYIFVRINFTPYYALEVLKIKGVVRFLGESNQRPVDIPDIQIESLKTVIASGEQILPFAYLRVGQGVRVRSGPFEGCEGLLVRMNTGKDRLVISLELLQRSVSVELDAADVTPL